jgi:hypothetical protein
MAKAKDLAALAALAGLAYANRDKLFGGKGESKTDTGDETDRLLARNPAPIADTGDETDRLLARSPTPDYSNEGRNKPPKVSAPVTRSIRSGKSAAEAVAPTSDPRNLEAGMSRGTRPADPRNLEAGMSRGTRYKQPTLMKEGGMTSSASSRADGIATKGKTRGKIC